MIKATHPAFACIHSLYSFSGRLIRDNEYKHFLQVTSLDLRDIEYLSKNRLPHSVVIALK
jgi:hypothetical protein